jgi:hypothetical protein
MTISKFVGSILLMTALSPFTVRAQDAPSQSSNDLNSTSSGQKDSGEYRLARGMNEFGFWGGEGPSVATFSGLADTEATSRGTAIIGLRFGRLLHASNKIAFEYTVDVIPLAAAFNDIIRQDPTAPGVRVREHAYGFGANPIGLRFIFRPQRRIKPFVAVNLGMLYFTKQVPVPDSSRFNFSAELDCGLTIFSHLQRAVNLGFKFHHISNAATGSLNPGINSPMFYVGYSLFK